MARNEDPAELTPKQEQLILAMLRSATKDDAARAAGVSRRTMYNWLGLRTFRAALRAAQRSLFGNALMGLDRSAAAAVQLLTDVMNDPEEDSGVRVTAATKLLDRAFKAQDSIAVEEELADLRAIVDLAQAGQDQPPDPVAKAMLVETPRMTELEQAEAYRLRVAWMGEMGLGAQDIEASLRFNRPQSVADESQMLEVVSKLLESERVHDEMIRSYM
jgi:phage terminase small subunit